MEEYSCDMLETECTSQLYAKIRFDEVIHNFLKLCSTTNRVNDE
jgi:hypothetical protein